MFPFAWLSDTACIWISDFPAEEDCAKKKQKMSRTDNEPPRSCSHLVTERWIQWISHRKQQRYALDGELYTFDEFSVYYNENADEAWKSASHFSSLQEFCKEYGVWAYKYCCDEFWASSPAKFGLMFPCCCLLLVDAHHLNGKLKGSTLDSRRFCDNAWQIGPAGNEMMVFDFCTELHGSSHILGKLGRSEMVIVLNEFCAILDGSYTCYHLEMSEEAVAAARRHDHLEMSEVDVECMTGWLHVPCCDFMCHARPFVCMPCYILACHAVSWIFCVMPRQGFSAKLALNKISNILYACHLPRVHAIFLSAIEYSAKGPRLNTQQQGRAYPAWRPPPLCAHPCCWLLCIGCCV